ncbi:hypothetical protein [Streptomyces similanensis]|uniref:Uncharacterized protein n=1 Tax=Streptomyces similanensis TaxID=1274988 RepID=A0ABP9L640_9ACTN
MPTQATTAPTLTKKKSSQLERGDIVHTHGMRVRLDRLISRTGESECQVFAWQGTVLNLDEVLKAGHVPASFLRHWEGPYLVQNNRWSIQGNDLAPAWTVEEPVRITESQYNAAWHAVEGAAGEEGADPATVLHAVLWALGMAPPRAA